MSIRSDRRRVVIAASDFDTMQPIIPKLIRRVVLKRIWTYAQKHHIIDFNAPAVTQAQRDGHDAINAWGAGLFADVAAATTLTELLDTFDELEPWF